MSEKRVLIIRRDCKVCGHEFVNATDKQLFDHLKSHVSAGNMPAANVEAVEAPPRDSDDLPAGDTCPA